MLPEKELKTDSAPNGLQLMERGQVMARLREVGNWLFSPPAVATTQESLGWQAGLCVDPTRFTDQLVRLQISLHGANNGVGSDVVETTGVSAGKN
jgi:hypothetical protein